MKYCARAKGGGTASRLLSSLPDECWVRVFAFLEAVELSGCASALCAGALSLTSQPQLWVELLYGDFCASFAQRALLRTWLAMHHHLHPRQLYAFKRREHRFDLDIARTELQQRREQVRVQDRKQRRLRILNFILVRVTHLLLCVSMLGSTVLLWLRIDKIVELPFYTVLAPIFVFEVFVLLSALVAFFIYCSRGSSGWTFYWNRLRGAIRWLILYTSPWEGVAVLFLGSSVAPLLACSLEGDKLLPWPYPRYALPFGAFWLSLLVFVGSLVRRRSISASCIGSIALLWLPTVSMSVLLFLRLSVFPNLPAYAVFGPSLVATSVLLLFVGFLVVASFWLGYRGNGDYMEYAAITLLSLLTLLLPLLLLQFAILGYLCGRLNADGVLFPWVIWLSGMLLCAIWHLFTPLSTTPSVPPLDRLTRPWRQQTQDRDSPNSDNELLLPPLTGGV
eukprot:TRINITY_DN34067_c0_g1_i1.p1 TRINITY_DN34067_c0_g1~~TRINITY_DN34067_c0_g1_i1.p1  ORF type:complete len:449 (+),score=34.67 TRINITY_DN34067_c0_g1_i1:207-1553(+)